MKLYDVNKFIDQYEWVEAHVIENADAVITAKDTQFFVPAESVFENKFFILSRQHKLLVLEKSDEGIALFMLDPAELTFTIKVHDGKFND